MSIHDQVSIIILSKLYKAFCSMINKFVNDVANDINSHFGCTDSEWTPEEMCNYTTYYNHLVYHTSNAKSAMRWIIENFIAIRRYSSKCSEKGIIQWNAFLSDMAEKYADGYENIVFADSVIDTIYEPSEEVSELTKIWKEIFTMAADRMDIPVDGLMDSQENTDKGEE